MRTKIVTVLVCACAGWLPPVAAGPNVILIMTDDQGFGDFSCHGNPVLRTPNLDRLAAESIRLTDFHVAPACTPTRGQLLTGLDALRNGATSPTGQRFLLKRNLPTIGDIFVASGYRTALYGKWHLGGNFRDFMPHERGFQDAVYFLRGGVQSHPNYWNNDLQDDYLYYNGRLRQYPGYATDLWFELGTKFIRECKRDQQPFFLYLPLNAPHGPLLVPDRFRAPYTHVDKATATFFGMIATVDERLAEFLRMLDDEGLREDTIVVFLTDNGTANGEAVFHAGLRGKKGSLYEGGHHVPCWIRWPGGDLLPPSDIDALCHCQDILPTLIELCGLKTHGHHTFDGVNLAPQLRGDPHPVLDERQLVVQRSETEGQGTVLWRKWRLVQGSELYDVAADPGQQENVAAKHPDVVKRMQAHYEQWWRGVEPHLGLEPYRIGVGDDETKLTAYDWWYGRRVYNWPHLRRGETSTGSYEVRIDQPGRYQVSLRRWPRESGAGICESVPRYVPFDDYMAFEEEWEAFPPGRAFDVVTARVRIGEREQTRSVSSDDDEVPLIFELHEGETQLQTWFHTRDGRAFGAPYVYIRRL